MGYVAKVSVDKLIGGETEIGKMTLWAQTSARMLCSRNSSLRWELFTLGTLLQPLRQ
jgi:hypothetical protein